MSKKKIYTIYDRNKPIGNYTAEEAAEALGITSKNVSTYAKSGYKYKGKYSFYPQNEPQKETPEEALKEEPEEKAYIGKELAIDWDFTTKMLLAVGGRKAHGTG